MKLFSYKHGETIAVSDCNSKDVVQSMYLMQLSQRWRCIGADRLIMLIIVLMLRDGRYSHLI